MAWTLEDERREWSRDFRFCRAALLMAGGGTYADATRETAEREADLMAATRARRFGAVEQAVEPLEHEWEGFGEDTRCAKCSAAAGGLRAYDPCPGKVQR